MSWRFSLAILACTAALGGSLSEIESRISEFRLANGMKFIVLERHLAPVVSVRITADVGSAMDPVNQTGTAHMLEHVAFKGTSTIGTTDFTRENVLLGQVDEAFAALKRARSTSPSDSPELKRLRDNFETLQTQAAEYVDTDLIKLINSAGGVGLNAATSMDATTFFCNLPSNVLELWFYLESQRFSDPVFRDFYKERSVVMQERRLRIGSQPLGALYEKFLDAAFIQNPYHRPVLGYMDDLDNLSRPEVNSFFKKYYCASNLTAVIVGNTTVAEVKRLAESYFGPLPRRPKPARPHFVEPSQNAPRSVTLSMAAQPMVCLGYRKPDIAAVDNAPYEILNSILVLGRSSRFTRDLQQKRIVASFFGAVSYPGEKYQNLEMFCLSPAPGLTNDDILKSAAEEFETAKSLGFSETEVQAAKAKFRATLFYQLRENRTVAGQLGKWEDVTGSWRNLFRYVEKIEAVTPADVQRAARTLLRPQNLTIARLEPPQRPELPQKSASPAGSASPQRSKAEK